MPPQPPPQQPPGFAPRLPGTFSRTFWGTLLSLAWLCTKAAPKPPRPSPGPFWTWPKASQTFSGTFPGIFSETLLNRNLLWILLRNPIEPDFTLHQAFLEPSPGSAPKAPRPCPEPSAEPSPELNLTWLCPKTFSGTFATFSGTSLSLTRRLHQCTPELFWAEDPISLRCWGKQTKCLIFWNLIKKDSFQPHLATGQPPKPQAVCFCHASETAKHHLVSCPQGSKIMQPASPQSTGCMDMWRVRNSKTPPNLGSEISRQKCLTSFLKPYYDRQVFSFFQLLQPNFVPKRWQNKPPKMPNVLSETLPIFS